MVGQVNAALIAKNKAPMGFINPWLYGAGLSAMNDVTTGASVGCNGKSGFGETLPPELGAKVLNPPHPFCTGRPLRALRLDTPDYASMWLTDSTDCAKCELASSRGLGCCDWSWIT